MDPEQRSVVVAGAAGALGEGICAALLEAGYAVHGIDRDAVGLARLLESRGHEDRLRTHALDLTQAPGVAVLVDEIFDGDPSPRAVVACLGQWWNEGPLCEQEYPAALHGVMHSTLVPHLILARHVIPRLRDVEGARYLMINGGTADLPEPNCGLLNVSAAAQRMLSMVLAEEEPEVEVASLQLCGPVRSRKLSDGPERWMEARGVGEACVRLLDSPRKIDGKCFRARDAASLAVTG
jgi:NAD(P)-dependent dehydrogenase (short-subunit alcohol dehydrogenase family)